MKALNGQETGTVLWWSGQDGVIIDEAGNEYYFDRSTWKGRTAPIRKQLLKFTGERLSCGTLVAKEVSDLLA
jgi:hypothetical protein